jgi:hypothetical protein
VRGRRRPAWPQLRRASGRLRGPRNVLEIFSWTGCLKSVRFYAHPLKSQIILVKSQFFLGQKLPSGCSVVFSSVAAWLSVITGAAAVTGIGATG